MLGKVADIDPLSMYARSPFCDRVDECSAQPSGRENKKTDGAIVFLSSIGVCVCVDNADYYASYTR